MGEFYHHTAAPWVHERRRGIRQQIAAFRWKSLPVRQMEGREQNLERD